VGSFLNSYTADKYDGLMARKLQGASYFRLGRDVRVFIIFLGALLNLSLVTLGFVALVMNVEVVRRIVVCFRTDDKR
jgi:CDP-L-myo-inositol myo-inositolphosphotransferase